MAKSKDPVKAANDAKKQARKDLAAAFERGAGSRFTIARDVATLREKAFEKTLGAAIDDRGPSYWTGKAKRFAMKNAKAMGKVAATLTDVAGRTKITRDDYAQAANVVIAKAQEQCPPGATGELEARGPQCIAWGDGLEP